MPASVELFKKYPNRWFIETGSYKGDGIQCAIDAGFQLISSVELSEVLYRQCCRRFSKEMANGQLELFWGDSSNLLDIVIGGIKQQLTFWLDGHYSEGCTAKGNEITPVLKELDIIAKHPIKTHTILIDDCRLFGTSHFGMITEEDIIKALKLINKEYVISKDTGHPDYPMDVLVAKTQQEK